MIRVEATGNGQFSYGVFVKGFVDYSEYRQILDNLEEIKSLIKVIGNVLGYEKDVKE